MCGLAAAENNGESHQRTRTNWASWKERKREILPSRPLETLRKQKVIGTGTFGTVWEAEDRLEGNRKVALKKLNNTYDAQGFPYYMLREVLYLLKLEHPHIVQGIGIAVSHDFPPVFHIMMELLDSDLARVLDVQVDLKRAGVGSFNFSVGQVKSLLRQLLLAMSYLHSLMILHRDLKPANLLISSQGVLKVGDLGSIRPTGEGTLAMTVDVTTITYRPPELVCCYPHYSSAVDMWSIGCIFFELLKGKSLFPVNKEVDTFRKMVRLKGAPPESLWHAWRATANFPERGERAIVRTIERHPSPQPLNLVSRLSPEGTELLAAMLEWDPKRRITAQQALAHPFFSQDPPLQDPVIHPLVLTQLKLLSSPPSYLDHLED